MYGVHKRLEDCWHCKKRKGGRKNKLNENAKFEIVVQHFRGGEGELLKP